MGVYFAISGMNSELRMVQCLTHFLLRTIIVYLQNVIEQEMENITFENKKKMLRLKW